MYIYLYFMSLLSLPSVFFPKFACIYIYDTYPSTYLYICNMYSNLIPKTHRISRISGPKCTSFPATAGFGLALAMGRDGWPGLRKCMDLRRALKVGLEDRCGRYAPPCGFSFSIMEESNLINLDVFVACFLFMNLEIYCSILVKHIVVLVWMIRSGTADVWSPLFLII